LAALQTALRDASLSRSAGFTIVAVLILALDGRYDSDLQRGDAVLLSPLPIAIRSVSASCGRLCRRNIEWDWTSYPAIRDWREQNRLFQDIFVILRPEASRVTLHGSLGNRSCAFQFAFWN